MRVAVGEQVEMSGRNIPTGRKLPLSEQFARLREGGLRVTDCEPIEAGFTLREIEVDGKPFRGALVENLRTGVRTFYEVDRQTTYAPNAADPAAEGFQAIAPGESWRMKFRLYAK